MEDIKPNKTTQELIDHVFNSLNCSEDLTKKIIKYFLEDIALFDKKQKDYGPANISKFGIFGVIVRVSDKIERLLHLHQKSLQSDTYPISVQNEPIEDSWTDLSVYGAIARAVNNDEWSKEP